LILAKYIIKERNEICIYGEEYQNFGAFSKFLSWMQFSGTKSINDIVRIHHHLNVKIQHDLWHKEKTWPKSGTTS
jgi:hypothetical protein